VKVIIIVTSRQPEIRAKTEETHEESFVDHGDLAVMVLRGLSAGDLSGQADKDRRWKHGGRLF
jgi:hypothetical protein